jgi:hypothetical protein
MLGIGAAIMVYVRATKSRAYFATPREAFQAEAKEVAAPTRHP